MATQSKSQKQSRERILAHNELASSHETKDLKDVLNEGEKRNAELKVSPDQYGEEDLINKLTTKNPDLKFGNIAGIGIITLSLLLDNYWRGSFKRCINKITSDEIKKALMQEMFHKVQNEIGTDKPYDDFEEICFIPGDLDVLGYFLNIISYLEGKENPDQEDAPRGKKTMDIISKITISISDVNGRLSNPIAPETTLSEIPEDMKNSFDALLSFEFGKGLNKAKDITENRMEQFSLLFTNGFPAINTIIGEDEKYRYNEKEILKNPKYIEDLEKIQKEYKYEEGDNKKEKEKKRLKMLEEIRKLKWDYYLQYLGDKNPKLASILRELYNNDFDYSELSDDALKGYLDIVVNKRLNKFKDGIKSIIDENFDNFDEFLKFYKDLADPSSTTININSGFTSSSHTKDSVELPITKSIIKRKNMWLKDIDSFGGNPLSYDTLPFRYEIKKDDIDKLDMTDDYKNQLKGYLTRFKDENDKFVIEGEDVGGLILLFFVFNNKSPIKEVNHETQKEVEDLLTEENSDKNDEKGNDEGDESLTPEQFKEKIEKLGPGKFENGSEIWLPIGSSQLPGGGYQWMKIKISDIDMGKGTFKGTAFGGELKFSSNLEGKSQNFKMNQEFFDGLEKILKKASASPETIWLQPNPDTSNFSSFVDSLKGRLGKTNDFKFPPQGTGLIWKDKFMYEVGDDKNEVKYFGAANDNKSTYKIEYNPTRRSFTVYTTYNGDEKGKDGKNEKKRFSYKRNMDWNNFLIFFTQKGLQPQTEEEANDAIQMQEQELKIVNGGKLSLHWFSLNTIKNGFKDIWGAVKKGMDDYSKKQEREFKEIVEKPLLDAVSALPLIPSLKYAVGKRQQELYADQVNGAWPKIEEYLKEFQSDEQFADTFDQLPPNVKTLHGKSYKDFIKDLFYYKGTREIKLDDRHKAAAILLANIQKGGSPYRGLTEYQDMGLWVKVLLGQEHYNKFLRDKQKCIDDLKREGKDKDQIQHTLANGEMEYIINNICGSNGKLPYFGSHEARGYPGKGYATNYIVNPSKRDLSQKFAGELRSAYQSRFTASSVDTEFENISKSHNNFEQAKADVKRLLTSARNPGAIGNLRAMFKIAKTQDQLLECDRHFLIYMLSGILDVYGTKSLRKQAYEWGITTSFLPGMLAKETGHSEQVVQLLDDFCEEKGYKKFSEVVTSYFKKSDLKSGKMDIDGLFEQVLDDSKRSLERMKEFEEYSKVTFRSKDFSSKPKLNKLQQIALNPDTENINNSILENKLIANRSGLFSNANVVRDRMSFDGSGQFSGKDEDEKGDRKEFWNNVRTDIGKMNPKNEKHLAIVLTQFLNFFNMNSESSKQEILKWVNTADYWSKTGKMGKMATYPSEPEPGEDYINMGVIGKAEIDSILWYTFKGRVLLECLGGKRIPAELMGALDAFQNFFQDAFNNKDGTNTFKHPSIISKGFQLAKSPQNEDAFSLCSWNLFNSLIDNENRKELHLDDKQTEIAKTIMNGDIINYKIAQMERALNRSGEEYFKPIRGSRQQTLRNQLSE